MVKTPKSWNIGGQKFLQGFSSYVTALMCFLCGLALMFVFIQQIDNLNNRRLTVYIIQIRPVFMESG